MIAGLVVGAGATLTLWVLFGYPLALRWLARRPRPVQKTFNARTVSILLPVADGERWIRRKLESLLALDYPRDKVEIIVISDGSTDNTDAIVEEFSSRGVRLIRAQKSGKAVALNHGMAAASGDILFFTDVRQPIAPESLTHLVACLEDPAVGVATGELIIRDGHSQEEANIGLYWRYEKDVRKRLSAIDSILGSSGCIYAMRRKLAAPLPAGTLLDDVYLPLRAFFMGFRVVVEPQAVAYDDPTSLQTEFRRKVRTQAGMYQIISAYPALLGPRNRMWVHFVSHKLGRLMLPFILLAVLIATFWLPPVLMQITLGAQVLFYALAILDTSVPEGWYVKRLTSKIRAFVVLIAAAMCGIVILFVPPQRLWNRTSVPQTSNQPAPRMSTPQ